MRPITVRDWFGVYLRESAADEDAMVGNTGGAERIGELELAPFQQRAVLRGLKIARAYGGVLLADAVGLGKTRVGLAMAAALRRDARIRGAGGRAGPILCCAPARLGTQWREAAIAAGVADFEVITHTAMSRGLLAPDVHPSVILVDEAHRFRNPNARRSRRLCDLAARAPLVLMSATPVCNNQWDLYHLFRLFLGDHDLRRAIGHNLKEAFELAQAGDFDLSELVEHLVIRRVEAPSTIGFGRRPDVALEVLTYRAGADEVWLWKNLEAEFERLSMELFREDWPRQLLTEYLLKRWESGADALWATLLEMVDFHRRWLQADSHAHQLSRSDFRRLFRSEARAEFELSVAGGFRGGAVAARQAVFPFFYDFSGQSQNVSRETLRPIERHQVERDLGLLRALLGRVESVAKNGDDKRRAIFELIASDAQKILVFTSYQQAARGLYDYLIRRLGPQARVGLVTGEGAYATGLGKTRADELVRRFAPISNGASQMPKHQQIDVLIGTDCLSEGVNLQDCSRVVLADLPYSPLGVEQRIGRLLRPGASAETATVYLPRPDCWADSLGLRRRLDRKISQAAHVGANFVAARHLSDEPSSTVEKPADNTLAALTRFDALRRSFGEEPERARLEGAGFGRARVRRGGRRLWLRVAVSEAKSTRYIWCRSALNEAPKMRLSAVIDGLIEDSNGSAPLEAIGQDALDSTLYEPARALIRERERLLRSARLAPYPLRLDAPQRRIWAMISGAVEAHQMRVDRRALGEFRHELLRSFPRGVERRFEEMLRATMTPEKLYAQTRAILGEVPKWNPEISLTIVAGLELLPEGVAA